MRLGSVRAAALLLAVCLGGCGDDDQAVCRVDTVADLTLFAGTERPIVEASLGARKVAWLIDTGAQTSVVTPDAVDRFRLPSAASARVRIRGIGGSEFAPAVTLQDLVLGRGHVTTLDLPVATSLHGSIAGIPVIGLFGADFMSRYDVDLDVPGHRFALRRLQGCGSDIVPFKGDYFEVPFRIEHTAIMVDIKVNGVPIEAQLDSGASTTLIDQSDARRIGLTADRLAGDRVFHARAGAIDRVDMTLHRFDSLEIGPEHLNNFPFVIADTQAGVTLLGDDFLRHNRVWISYPLNRLYIQPAARDPMVRQLDATPAGPH